MSSTTNVLTVTLQYFAGVLGTTISSEEETIVCMPVSHLIGNVFDGVSATYRKRKTAIILSSFLFCVLQTEKE